MATESFLVTALPYSAARAQAFHVSLFVTHRLTPDGAAGALGEFPTARDWTARLAGARVVLRGGGATGGAFDIPCTPLLAPLDAALWPRVFPASLPVRPWPVPDRAAAPWRTFPAHRMQQHALLAHAASLYSSPVAPPSVAGNALTEPLLESLGVSVRQLPLARVIDGKLDEQIGRRLDDLSGGGGLRGPVFDGAQPMLQLVADVHRARRFFQRDDAARNPYRERPDPAFAPTPVTRPTPDFHERAGMLGDLSPLLRRLGLVIDLRVDDLALLAGAAWIQGDILFEGRSARSQPRTACRVVGETFTATSATGDWELGMLRLGDEARFTVLDLDPDASALKLEQYARTLPRLAASERNGDPTSGAPASLRATGFALARVDRAQQLHDRLADAPAQDAALLAGTAPPLALEQVTRGVRLEVWDDASNRWHSLHRRLLTVDVADGGRVLDRVPDAGFLQGAALASHEGDAAATRYAHEVLAGWDGWSLAAPRPGRVVVHENGEEKVMDAPPADPDPVHPVASSTEVAPGTLPRLRYGRSYAFRAYAVDLAGNSRPHDVAGAAVDESAAAGEALALGDAEAAQLAQARLAARVLDATRVTTQPNGGAATELLRSRVQALRGARVVGPVASGGAPGVDPGGIAATRLADVDRLITARVAQRAERLGALGVTRAQQIDVAFGDATARVPYFLARPDLQLPPTVAAGALSTLVAQQRGLAAAVGRAGGLDVGQLVALLGDVVTTARPFLRWDPVLEPAAVARHAFTEGESLLRLVIRSGVEQSAPGAPGVTITPPADYVAQVTAAHPELGLAWRADSQRHLAPPKASQLDAELHGAFEAAMGPGAPADRVRTALGIALREAGTFLDTTVADLANPGQRLPQPGVTFHLTPTAEVPAVADPADLPRGDAPSPGQYVAHDVDQVVLPYLPDPIAAGVSLTFPDAGQDHHLAGLFAVEGITLRYVGEWPERVPFRFVLESGPELGAVVDGHVVRVSVPPGEQLRLRLSSSLDRASLDLLGLWRSLPPVIRDNPLLREAAADGWFWWLTPATEVRLVHAVPRPVEVPRPTLLVPVRTAGDTAVTLVGAVDVHGPSTERIDVEASWSEWVDDVTKPAPERVDASAAACGTAVGYDEDLVVLSAADASVPLPDGTTLRLHGAVHQTGDTRHRTVAYRVRATTRYREYFPPPLTPEIDDLSVVGPTRTLDVPSSARPRRVIVRDVLPLFRWDERTEPAQPFGLRRSRRAGVRIYLERPWYSTGDGELLGVLVAAGSDALVHGSVSQWGADPVFVQQGPAARGTLPLVDLLHLSGLDDRPVAGRPVAPPASRPLVDRDGQPSVWVLGYRPEYAPDRGLWFVDVALDPGPSLWPFVQLAVARYQPSSLPGLHLGPVTMCDFVQVAPERTATLSRTDETHARVVVSGAVGHPRVPGVVAGAGGAPSFVDAVATTRRMRARLERFDPAVGTDLAWVTAAQVDLPILGVDATVVSWAGELALPPALTPRTPGENAAWRVTLEEWELLPADTEAGGTGGWEPRIVYADHLAL